MEDLRAAAGIHAGVSSQIFGASLVLIGVLIGYLDIKGIEYSSTEGILIFVGIFLLLVSVCIAGKGLQKIRDNGAIGIWTLDDVHIYFRLQTILNLISIAVFLVIVMKTNNESSEEKFQKKLVEIELRHLKLDSIAILINQKQIKLLDSKIDSLNHKLEGLSCCKKRTKNPCR